MTSNKNLPNSPSKRKQDFPIVGIGASAGGLEAFIKLIENIDENSGMAYVFVQHLSATHKSELTEILSNFTTLPVFEIRDNINLAPDHIYVIPENRIVTAMDGVLKLTMRDKNSKQNRAIDQFFKSLAEVHEAFAIAVLLSGTGNDGIEGLKTIKEKGGMTVAQAPETAAFEGMPLNAIHSGSVDFILKPEEIPMNLRHVKNVYKKYHAYLDEIEQENFVDENFIQIRETIHLRSSHDFTYYKPAILRNRIARRMAVTSNTNMGKYVDYLKTHVDEQESLINEILIPVSYFFRDPEIFDSLNDKVFPALLKNKTHDDPIRIWVAGCSTGEEAYSIAICLHEFLVEKSLINKVQVFASDISSNVNSKARIGLYSYEDVQNISETRLSDYFIKKNGSYQISKVIRDMCVFAVHDFLKDPPFSRMDMVICRNVLISFTQENQKNTLLKFHYALNKSGILFIGKSETTNTVESLFEPLIKNHKIYVRNGDPSNHNFKNHYRRVAQSERPTSNYSPKTQQEPDLIKLANDIIFNRFTPAGVIVDQNWEIIHFHGDTGPFIGQSTGKASLNLLKMAREGLNFELKNALLKSGIEGKISKKGIPINSTEYVVDFDIIPISSDSDPHFIVLFQAKIISEDVVLRNQPDKKRIKMLEAELVQLRKDIWSVSEQQEVAYEELQLAHEELTSSSEELQCLNEELDTTFEELQSNNEALTKILLESEERFRAMANSAPYILWISKPDGKIDFFNQSWLDYTGLEIEQSKELGWTEGIFEEDRKAVLEESQKRFKVKEPFNIEFRLRKHNGEYRWINLKGVPRYNPDGDFMGYIGGGTDIHEQKIFSSALEEKVEIRTEELKESQNFLESILNMTQNLIYIYDFEKEKIVFVNTKITHCTGYSPEEIVEAPQDIYTPMIHHDDLDHVINQREKLRKSSNDKMVTMEFRIQHRDGGWTCQLSQGLVFQRDEKGKVVQYVGVSTDVSELKTANKQLKDKNNELERNNNELGSFSSIASHDLKEPLRKIQFFLNIILEKEKGVVSEESQAYLDRVLISANRMQQLIDDLISYSRTSGQKIRLTSTDLNKLMEEVLDELKENLEENLAHVSVSPMPTVQVIPSQFRQLFVNLIGNAIKYKRTSPIIKISSEKADQNEIQDINGNIKMNYYKLSVSDNGIGFSSAYSEKIFEPFQRLHGKDEYSGTGIGLAICRKIMTNHRGYILADSQEGEGSTFKIYVPFKN